MYNTYQTVHSRAEAPLDRGLSFCLFAPLSNCPISVGSDSWIALPPRCWIYRCTQLLPRNNVITPINSHVMLAAPANCETKISLSLLSLFTFPLQCGDAMSLFSHAWGCHRDCCGLCAAARSPTLLALFFCLAGSPGWNIVSFTGFE